MVNHNSVLGIRDVARDVNASISVAWHEDVDDWLDELASQPDEDRDGPLSLFAYPAEENFAGQIFPLRWAAKIASREGQLRTWRVLLDAAKFSSSHPLNLTEARADFVTLSFYKLFGYPTGVGALIIRSQTAFELKKHYWGGGSVSLAGAGRTDSDDLKVFKGRIAERFEDGTVAFLGIASLRHGFDALARVGGMAAIERHTSCLAAELHRQLAELQHSNGSPVIAMYSRDIGVDASGQLVQGPIVNFNVLRADSTLISHIDVMATAAEAGIHIRAGMHCNPGAATTVLGLPPEAIRDAAQDTSIQGCGSGPAFVKCRASAVRAISDEACHRLYTGRPSVTPAPPSAKMDFMDALQGLEPQWEMPFGSVRASVGYLSTFEDIQRLVLFLSTELLLDSLALYLFKLAEPEDGVFATAGQTNIAKTLIAPSCMSAQTLMRPWLDIPYVTYSSEGFLEKNVDKPPDEAADLLKGSKLVVLQEIGGAIADELAEATGGPGKKKAKTVSSGFRSSLAQLVQKLNEADPHFIRCVKPNAEKVPNKFTSKLVMEQLTCSGVFEAVRIRQSGFAARVPFGDFLGRYRIVVPKAKHKAIFSAASEPERAKAFLEALPEALEPLGGAPAGDLVLGKTKIFAKQAVMIRLDKARDMAVSTYAIDIQRVWRGYRARKKLATCKVVFDELKAWCARNDFYTKPGSTAVQKLKEPSAIRSEAAKVEEICKKAEGLPLPLPRRKEVEKVKQRMENEAKEIELLKAITKSIDPIEIESAVARAKDLELQSLPEVGVLQERFSKLSKQLPLIKAITTALDEEAEGSTEFAFIVTAFTAYQSSKWRAGHARQVPDASTAQPQEARLDAGASTPAPPGASFQPGLEHILLDAPDWEDKCVYDAFPRPPPVVRL
ncbi:MOCOS [Symbiodinium natans]|uniref:MOCOS protein n=1 Tax=Symbiodinium natans TaxID=878477 RepID=A0A812MDJ6_9DINO|nr:MOCOS [Symbiodinium natans]